jgi:hypothetical protein
MEMLASIKSIELCCTEQEEEQNKEAGVLINVKAEEYPELSEFGIHLESFEDEEVSRVGFGQIRLKAETFNVQLGDNNGSRAFESAHTFNDIKFSSVCMNHQEGFGFILSLKCRLSVSSPAFWKWLLDNFRPSLFKLVINPMQMSIGDIKEEE